MDRVRVTWAAARTTVAFLAVLFSGVAAAAGDHILRSSLYYSALQTDYPSGGTAAFRDVNGSVLDVGSRDFHAAASIEGTAVFSDGTILNFDRLIGGEVRWKQTESHYGLDARGCALVPFRSAAVDPSVIPLGTKLLIAETRGMRLPDGALHDGIWIATDTGQELKGARIDLFTGRGIASMTTVEQIGIGYLDPLNVKVLDRNLPCP